MKMPPKTYLFSLVLIVGILIFIALSYMNMIEHQDIFWIMQEFIVRWSFIFIFAIIGGVFFGMLLGHRILSVNQFTPFEKAMLEMRSEIKSIKEKFDEYDANEVISKIIAIEKELRTFQGRPSSNQSAGREEPNDPSSRVMEEANVPGNDA